MTALLSAFAEYLFKFVVYLLVAALGILTGMRLKTSRRRERQHRQ